MKDGICIDELEVRRDGMGEKKLKQEQDRIGRRGEKNGVKGSGEKKKKSGKMENV